MGNDDCLLIVFNLFFRKFIFRYSGQNNKTIEVNNLGTNMDIVAIVQQSRLLLLPFRP